MVKPIPNPAQEITFSDLCDYLDRISSRKPKKAGAPKSARYNNQNAQDFETWLKHHWPVPKNTGKIIFRLLFPDQDVRRKYDLKEARLGKYLGIIFAVQTGPGQRGEGLLKWNSTSEDHNGLETGRTGCIGLELEKIRQDMETELSEKLTLSAVDRLLDELAAKSSWSNLGKGRIRPPFRPATTILQDLYQSLSPRHCAYMTQIILKDLRPLLYPIPSLSVYRSLLEYDSTAFKEIDRYSMMKAWHWAMPRIYRAKADFDVAADLCEQIPRDKTLSTPRTEELLKKFTKPRLGTLVNIPKAVKASGPCLAAPLSKLTGQVWAETKMDGERMQIHIDTSKADDEQIRIFSKSHRDSTIERAPTHDLIRATLGLHSQITPESLGSTPRPSTLQPIKSGIFEAEMVAWNMDHGQVDEFWRIRELKNKPWQVHKRQTVDRPTPTFTDSQIDEMDSQQLSDLESRHLALCFFDVLYLNDVSLLECPYNERRRILEDCIHVIPHYSMLVDRKPFDMSRDSGKDALRKHYARVIAERHEGLVLKTAESIYNDWRSEHKWLKVKKDYIDGLGDTADYAIIGAAWDPNRGRELGVPTSIFTSWYIGLCGNTLDIERMPGTRPHFHLAFTSLSYGLTRQQLEKVNRIARDADGESPDRPKAMQDWPFTYETAEGLKEPTIIFKKPLVFELMGSGFTKHSRRNHYELRWPRITKVHDAAERDWTNAVDLEKHDEMAKRATDPKLLKIADITSSGSQEAAENGFQAELEHWNEKLKTSDLNWIPRGSNLRSDLAETSARSIASKPAKTAPLSTNQKKSQQTVPSQMPHVSSKAPNQGSSIFKAEKSAKSDQQIEVTSHLASPVTTRQKSTETTPPDDTSIIADVNPSIRSKSSLSKETTAGGKVSPQVKLKLFSGLDSIRQPLKRKASVAESDKKFTAVASQMVMDSEHSAESNTKRRKTSERNPHPEVFLDKTTLPVLTANTDKLALPQVTSPRGTSTSQKRSIPIKVVETQSPARSSIRARVQTPTSTLTGSVTPQLRNFFLDDPLDFEKDALSQPPNPIKSPAAPNRASSINTIPGPTASSSGSIQRKRRVTDLPAKGQPTMPPVQKSRSGPLAPFSHANDEIETSASTTSGNPGQEITSAKNSGPPWHQNFDVRWCLVHDEQTYDIQGTRFGSVNQLLQALEINQNEFNHKPRIDSPSYIFIENPTPESLCRVQKQIIFRSLSNPCIGIVGYDAKVLKLPQANHDTWKSFELFRFNPSVQELLQDRDENGQES